MIREKWGQELQEQKQVSRKATAQMKKKALREKQRQCLQKGQHSRPEAGPAWMWW